MPNFKDFVANLGAANALDDADVVPVVQSGANKKATGAQIKAKGREGLATVATSGSYNDLTNKPTIPTQAVSSVNGKTGPVVLTEDDIGAGTTNAKYTTTEKTKLAGLSALAPATASVLGGVKVGSGLSVAVDGTLSAAGGGTAGVASVNSKTSAVTINGSGIVTVDNSGSNIVIGTSASAFNDAVGDSDSYTSLSNRVSALEGGEVDQATWNLSSAKQGSGAATTAFTLSSDGATGTANTASGNNFLRMFAADGIASTDAVYFVVKPTGGAATDFGIIVTTAAAEFVNNYLDGVNVGGTNASLAIRVTEGKVNVNGSGFEVAHYNNNPAVDGSAWLVYIDRPNNKGFARPLNYQLNFSSTANAQSGAGAFTLPPGWGSSVVYPAIGWVFPAAATPAGVQLVNKPADIAALFPTASFDGYKPLGAADQTGTGTGTNPGSTLERQGGKTEDYLAAAVAPDLSYGQASGGSNIAVPSANALWRRFATVIHWTSNDYINGATGTQLESRIVAAINNMGFGVIRDSIPNATAGARAQAVFSQISYLKIVLLTGADNGQTKKQLCDLAASYLPANAIIYVESSNEIDAGHFTDVFGDGNWDASYNYDKQGNTDRLARTDYIKNVPHTPPSFTQYYNAFEVAGSIPFFDVGVCHPYPGGRNPEQLGFGGTFSGSNGAGSYSYRYGDRRLSIWGDANLLAPGKKVIATETGYAVTPGVPTQNVNMQDGAGAASYAIRDFMYLIKLGMACVCKYELIKEPIDRSDSQYEGYLGLVNNDGTMNTTATYLSRFIKGIRETGTAAEAFTPGTISYSLGGAATTTAYLPSGAPTDGYGWTENCMSYAFQWSDGSWGIVLWRPSLRHNVDTGADYAGPTGVACTVTVSGKTVSGTPTLLDPSTTSGFVSTGVSRSSNVITIASLTDMPVILKFTAA